MHSASSPVKVATTALALGFMAVAIWVLRGYVWPTLSSVEVTVLQARLHPDWYRGDFIVQESLRFTPRFYYNELVLLPARAGIPLAWAFALEQVGMLMLLVGGLRSLATALALRPAAAAMLTVWLLIVSAGTVGDVYFYTHAPVPAVWAGVLVAWGAAAALRQRWIAAFGWFGAACLLQFLVGFYAGGLALFFLWREQTASRLAAPALWLLGLALVYVPMKLGGGTGDGELTSAGFVEIYAQLRHPHHLVPSSWGWAVWVQAGAFYAGVWWLTCRPGSEGGAVRTRILGPTLALAAGALVLNYIFVEWYPLALVAKLQPARVTPLAQGIFLAALAQVMSARLARRDFFGAALLAAIPLSPFPGFLLLLFAVLLPPDGAKSTWRQAVMTVAVLLAFQPLDPSIAARGVRYALWLGIFLAWIATDFLGRRTVLAALAALLAGAGALACAVASTSPRWPPYLVQRFCIDAPPSDAPGRIGNRFGANAPVDALVLTPPDDEGSNFKLYAHRAVVVDDKDFPFTDRGMHEWRVRMDDVLGASRERRMDLAAAWRARTPGELAAVAAHYGARYVLTRDDWHPEMPGRRLDSDAGWSLWVLR